jgi:choline dehydrogenase
MSPDSEPTRVHSRRRFLQVLAALSSGAGGLLAGCVNLLKSTRQQRPFPDLACTPPPEGDEFDYVVVGSGAGGGPLASRLALAGFRVLLLEAGGDDDSYDYQVPAFHPRASEDERMAWNFYVRHYANDARQNRDEKYRPDKGGVLYPRSSTLGGCTAHNAMILIYPHNSDWDHVAEVTGDDSWRAENMRRYFQRLERCGYDDSSDTGSRHGFNGWLATNVADPMLMVRDASLKKLFAAAASESVEARNPSLPQTVLKIHRHLDPNDWRLVQSSTEGICITPLSTYQGRRNGSREFLRHASEACEGNLEIRTHALASRVLLDEHNRAIGIEYLSGRSLYRADPRCRDDAPATRSRAYARREVILCGGAFNTPQLLKLSGIGPGQELAAHGITPRVDLAGVGENLQDRYEVCVVTRMKDTFSSISGMTFRPPEPGEEPDPLFEAWRRGEGPYTTNGAVVSMITRSSERQPEPDLFLFGLLGNFRGYYPGYSEDIARGQNFFTWAVLKAHSNNTAGRVRLRSADPRDMPEINFHYFDEGSAGGEEDLAAVVAGVETVRRITARVSDIIEEEVVPGSDVDSPEALRRFVEDEAWGHHASCTCKMGPATDPGAVVDSRFRVYGTQGLRVVDASVFPRIPGFFIVSSVYMISEKASDVIIEDAKTDPRERTVA